MMADSLHAFRLGFVGAGQMARALAQGWLRKQLIAGNQISAFDVSPAALSEFNKRVPGSKGASSNQQLVQNSDILILAVKPLAAREALAEIQPELTARHLLISIVAGVDASQLSKSAGPARSVRVMPNTPCMVGKGATAFSRGAHVQDADVQIVNTLFEAVGTCREVPESWLDTVTAVSGSGPAFVLLFLEGLVDGAVKMGLPRDVALQLAGQTVLGTAAMLLEEGTHPAILRDRVASPGGTTMAGLHALEKKGVRGAAIDAIEAATMQAKAMRVSSF
jgi:pyrroline-5-carboxylate reductase